MALPVEPFRKGFALYRRPFGVMEEMCLWYIYSSDTIAPKASRIVYADNKLKTPRIDGVDGKLSLTPEGTTECSRIDFSKTSVEDGYILLLDDSYSCGSSDWLEIKSGFYNRTSVVGNEGIVFSIVRPAANLTNWSTGVHNEPYWRFLIRTDGFLAWGPGSGPRDVFLYRSDDGFLESNTGLKLAKRIVWSDDTTIYRASANVLKTDDKFECPNADIGDGTNFTRINTDGSLEFHGNARAWKSIWLNIGALKPHPTSGASFVASGFVGAWEFQDGVTEYIICNLPLRTDIDRTEDVKIAIAWYSPATAGSCKWQLEYLPLKEGEDMTASASGTVTVAASPDAATANGLVKTEFTIPSTAIDNDDCLLLLRIGRLGADAEDTMPADAYLSAMCFEFISNKVGGAI